MARTLTHIQPTETLGARVKHHLEERIVALSHGVYDDLDWEQAVQKLRNPTLVYPPYYLAPHHGFTEGYLSNSQALGWTFVERFFRIASALPQLLSILGEVPPQHIVDLGCGVATVSLALAQRFPDAHLTLLDLSPYQLAAARHQAHLHGLQQRTSYLHVLAEQTGLASSAADLVMSTLLFHELPRLQARAVIREAQRILIPGGRFVEFDPIQRVVPWRWADNAINTLLARIIHEVYWLEYMHQPLWEACQDIGFQQVKRQLIVVFPWVYQVITAIK